MSEVINNRQQRVEIMKSLIRQLHNGAAREQVKHQLEMRQLEPLPEKKVFHISHPDDPSQWLTFIQ
jgi:hypothetical protein